MIEEEAKHISCFHIASFYIALLHFILAHFALHTIKVYIQLAVYRKLFLTNF